MPVRGDDRLPPLTTGWAPGNRGYYAEDGGGEVFDPHAFYNQMGPQSTSLSGASLYLSAAELAANSPATLDESRFYNSVAWNGRAVVPGGLRSSPELKAFNRSTIRDDKPDESRYLHQSPKLPFRVGFTTQHATSLTILTFDVGAVPSRCTHIL